MKTLGFFLIFYSLNSFSKISLKYDTKVPHEARFLFNCLSEHIGEKNLTSTINEFNESVSNLTNAKAIFVIKSEIYKFILSKNITPIHEESIKKRLNLLTKFRTKHCQFSQWIFHAMDSDFKKYISGKKNGPYSTKAKNYISYWILTISSFRGSKEKELAMSYHSLANLITQKLKYFASLRPDERPKKKSISIQKADKQTNGNSKNEQEKQLDQLFKST